MNTQSITVRATRTSMRFGRFVVLSSLLAAGAACSDTDDPGVTPDAGSADAAGTSGPRGLAVLLSDFQSMSLSLLDAATLVVVKDRCVDSGTRVPLLTQAFSADVVLSSQAQADSTVLVVDRANATLTWVETAGCSVVRQINVSTGFSANPHDALVLGGRVYVTRYETNANPTPAPGDHDEGSDILIIDLASGQPTARIALATHATMAAGTVLPRPDRMALIAGRIHVSLNNIGPSFAENEIGPGRAVVIDPATNAVVESLDPAGLANCSAVVSNTDATGLVLACNGNFKSASPVSTSGLAWFPRGAGAPAAKVLAAGTAFMRPVSFSGVAMLGNDTGVAVVPGDFGMPPADALWAFNLTAGTATKVFDASSGFVLGAVAVDAGRRRLVVANADAAAPVLELFDVTNPAAPQRTQAVNPSPVTNLPPRELVWY